MAVIVTERGIFNRKKDLLCKWGVRMKKLAYALYAAGMAGLLLFFFFLCFVTKNETFETRKEIGYTQIQAEEVHSIKQKGLPAGMKVEYSFLVSERSERERCLIFYTAHQETAVYIDNKLVYSKHLSRKVPFGKTPGSCWHTIPVYPDDYNKVIRVEIVPVYENVADVVPDFYLGSKISIFEGILRENLLQLFLSVAAIISGIIFLAFIFYNRKNTEVDKGLFMMGMFSVHVGIWKLTDMEAFSLFTQNQAALAYLPFISLLLVIIPFILFVKEFFAGKEHIAWYLLCFFACAVTVFSIFMQVTGRADLRQTLWLTHLGMAAMVVVVVTMIIKELRTRGWNKQLKIMAACMGLCLAGLVSDLTLYYISGGKSIMVLGMFGFLSYIIILGIMSVRETKRLMQIGMKAKRYERMAYHDQLTGLYNRTAYAEHTGSEEFTPKNCIAVMFDLNNLKKCNDTWGHEEGDRYIMSGTEMIKQAFEDIGRCYRMGGDEFCVLLKDVPLRDCEKRVQQMKIQMDTYNQEHPDSFPVKIACGYEIYNEEVDFDFGDTLRRADKKMYREKFMMKTREKSVRESLSGNAV